MTLSGFWLPPSSGAITPVRKMQICYLRGITLLIGSFWGSLLFLVFLGSGGSGLTGALSLFGFGGYKSAHLGGCSMFPFLLKKGNIIRVCG